MAIKDSFSESLRQRLQDAPQVDITQEESQPNVMTLHSVATKSQSFDSESSSGQQDPEIAKQQSSSDTENDIMKESKVDENEQENQISNQLNSNAQKLVSDIVQDILGVLIGIRDDLVQHQYGSDEDEYSYSDNYDGQYSYSDYGTSDSEFESADLDNQAGEQEPQDLSTTEDSFREADGILLSRQLIGNQAVKRQLTNDQQDKSVKKYSSRSGRKGTSFDQLLQNKIKLEQLRQYTELSSITSPQQITQSNIAQLLQQNQQAQVLFSGLAGNVTLSQLTQLINTAIESQLDKRLQDKKKASKESRSRRPSVDESVFDRLSKPKTTVQSLAQKTRLPKPQKTNQNRSLSPYNLIKMSNSKSKIASAGTLQLSSPDQKEILVYQNDDKITKQSKQQNVRSIADISHISRIDNKSVSDELSNAEVVYISNLIEDMNASQRQKEHNRNIQLSAQRLSRADIDDEQEGEENDEMDYPVQQNTQHNFSQQKSLKRPSSSFSQQKQSQKKYSQLENTFDRALLSNRGNNDQAPEILDQNEYNQSRQSQKSIKQSSSCNSVPPSSPHNDLGSPQRDRMRNSQLSKLRSASIRQKSLTSSKQQINAKTIKPSTKIYHTIARPASIGKVQTSIQNQTKPEIHSPKRQEKQKQPQTLTRNELDRARLRKEVQISHQNLRNKVTTLENEKQILEKDLAAYRAANISNTKHMSEEYKALKSRFQATTKELDALKLQYQQSLNDARHKNIELNKKLIKEANFLMDQLSKHTVNSVNPSPIRPISYGSINNDVPSIRRCGTTEEVRDAFSVVREPDTNLYKQKHIIESASPSPLRTGGVKAEPSKTSNVQEEKQPQVQKHKIILPPDTDRLQYSQAHQDKEKEVEISDIDYSAQQRIEIEHQRLQPIVNTVENKYESKPYKSPENALNTLKSQPASNTPQAVGYDTVRHQPVDVEKNLILTPAKNQIASMIAQQSLMTALSPISQPEHNLHKSSLIDNVPVQVANLKRIIQSHLSEILKSEKNAQDVQIHISQQVQDSLMKFKKMEEKTEERVDSLKLNEEEAVILRAQTKRKITSAIDDLCRNIVQQIQMRASMNQLKTTQSLSGEKNLDISNQQAEKLAKELSDSIGDIFQLKKSLVMPDVQNLRGLTALSTNLATTQQPKLQNIYKRDFDEDTSNSVQLRNYTDSDIPLSNEDRHQNNTQLDNRNNSLTNRQYSHDQREKQFQLEGFAGISIQTQDLSGKDREQVTPTQLKNSIRNNYQIINTIQQRLQGRSVHQEEPLKSMTQPTQQSNQQEYINTVYDGMDPSEVVDNTMRNISYTTVNIDNSINEQEKPEIDQSQQVKSIIYSKLDDQKQKDLNHNYSEEISEIIKPIETIGIYSILFTPELDLRETDEIKVMDILKREVGCLNAVPTQFIQMEEQTQSDLKIQHAFSVGIRQTPSVQLLQAKLLLVGFYNYGIRFIHLHKERFNSFSSILDDNKIYKQLVFVWSIYQFITETSEKMFQFNYNIYLSSIQRIALDCQNDNLDNLQYILVFNAVYLVLKDHNLKIQQDVLQTMGRIALQILEFQYQQPQLQYLGLISCGIYLMVQLTDKIINSQLQTKMCNTAGYLIQQYKELKYFKGYKQLFETQGTQ